MAKVTTTEKIVKNKSWRDFESGTYVKIEEVTYGFKSYIGTICLIFSDEGAKKYLISLEDGCYFCDDFGSIKVSLVKSIITINPEK